MRPFLRRGRPARLFARGSASTIPSFSLLGGLACLGVILAINLTAGIVALAILFAIYQYLKRTAGPARWADSRRSYSLQQTRKHLLAAETRSAAPP